MALKDCLAKMKEAGATIDSSDQTLLEGYLADGLTDEQAVRKLLLSSYQDVVDITDRARKASGGPAGNALVDTFNMQSGNLEKVRTERAALDAERAAIVEEQELIDELTIEIEDKSDFADSADGLITDEQLLQALSELHFNKDVNLSDYGLKGKTPEKMAAEFREMEARGIELSERMWELNNETAKLDDRVDTIFSGGRTLYQSKRGSATFDEEGKVIIRLTESRNLSTFLHESGHLWLELMGDLAELPDAPKQTVSDYAKILKYLGVKTRDDIKTEHHEKWAKSYEVYLKEGVAPSVDLQPAFAAYSGWLITVYRYIKTLAGIKLSDDIRGVMDRMLATDEAITEAERVHNFTAIYSTAEDMNLTPEAFAVYKEKVAAEHQREVDEQAVKMLAILTRAEKQAWKDESKRVRAEVTAEVHAMKVYQALYVLQRGILPDGSTPSFAAFKLDRASLVKEFGAKFIQRLPGSGKSSVYAAKGGANPSIAAGLFGFSSSTEMLEALINAPKMPQLIKAMTAERMAQLHPDPLVDGTLYTDAVEAVHSSRRPQILAAELKSLRAQVNQDRKIVSATKKAAAREDKEAREANAGQLPKRHQLAMIKAAAQTLVRKAKIRDINPTKWRILAQKSGEKAFKAAGKKDYQTAYDEKLKQIRYVEMYRAATNLKAQTLSAQKYMRRLQGKSAQKRLAKSGMYPEMMAVIDGVNLRTISLAQVDREAAIDELIEHAKSGRILVPEATLRKLRGRGTNWQDLTVEEFLGIRDVLKQLEHQAKALAKSVINGETVIFEDVKGKITAGVLGANKKVPVDPRRPTTGEEGKKGLKQGINHILRSATLARILDGAGYGALTRHVIVPMRRAVAEKMMPGFMKMDVDLEQIYTTYYTPEELGAFKLRRSIPGMADLSFEDMVSIGLNLGNESNQRALEGGVDLDGNPVYPAASVEHVMNQFTKRDWEFIQAMWDYLDSYWPQLKETEIRRRGISPERVEARSFKVHTADGHDMVIRGGYYPLSYDSRYVDNKSSSPVEDVMARFMNGVQLAAQTRAGATFERTRDHGKVVRLGLRTIDLHLREIIRDMAIGDEVAFIKRLLEDPDVKKAFKSTDNEGALRELNLWLVDSAVGELPAESIVERYVMWVRTGFVKSAIGWNALTTALQPLGLLQTMAAIGHEAFGHGIGEFVADPVGKYKEVLELSVFMKTRYITGAFNKDVSDTHVTLENAFGPIPTRLKKNMRMASSTYFMPIARTQAVVDAITWYGAHWKAMNVEGLAGQDAINYADAMVENSQTSGFFSDRSGIERGTLGPKNRQSQFVRIWTTLLSYQLAKGNIAIEKTQATIKNPNFGTTMKLASDLLVLYTIEAIMAAWLYGRLPDEDDEESKLWWAAKMTAESIVSGIPVVREIPGARFGGGNTPLGNVTNDFYRMLQQMEQGEMDLAFWRSINNVGGTLLHYPSGQANRALSAGWSEVMEGEDVPAYEYVTGDRD